MHHSAATACAGDQVRGHRLDKRFRAIKLEDLHKRNSRLSKKDRENCASRPEREMRVRIPGSSAANTCIALRVRADLGGREAADCIA